MAQSLTSVPAVIDALPMTRLGFGGGSSRSGNSRARAVSYESEWISSTERTTMSPETENQESQARMPSELAHRAADGIEVLLIWDRSDGRLRVVVDDLRDGSSFELLAGDGRQALDAFYHPFAYASARGGADSGRGLPRCAAADDEPAARACSRR
jgi:hypothetical protein